MVEVDSTIGLIGPQGPVTLLDVFEGCTLYNGQVRELSFLSRCGLHNCDGGPHGGAPGGGPGGG